MYTTEGIQGKRGTVQVHCNLRELTPPIPSGMDIYMSLSSALAVLDPTALGLGFLNFVDLSGLSFNYYIV